MSSNTDTRPLLELAGLRKVFPNGTVALRGVDLHVAQGSVHGLVGANGAGKSTLIKILAGAYKPSDGEIRWRGEVHAWRSPGDAQAAGIATLYQHVPVSPTLSVLENVFLGVGGWRRMTSDMRGAFDNLSERIGYRLDPRQLVGDLPIGQRQMVALLQALATGAALVVMDEPTASLSHHEREIVFDVVRRVSSNGTSFLYVSHFLDEVLDLTDGVTVLRDGQVSLDAPTAGLSEEVLVGAIVGRKLREVEERGAAGLPEVGGQPLLTASGISVPGRVAESSLSLAYGEIVGIAGLLGSGRTELLHAIFRARDDASGEVRIEEQVVDRSTVAAVHAGMALVPEDRDLQGLIEVLDLCENVTLPHLPSYARGGVFPERQREVRTALAAIADLGIRAPGPRAAVTELSGGNAQKVVFAKWLYEDARVLLLDEPTAGVDVGAKADILELIRSFAAEQRAVLMVSSEFDELIAVCHRILVLHKGHLVAERRSTETSEEELLALASGIDHAGAIHV